MSGNYLSKIFSVLTPNPGKTEIYDALITHDSWCGIFKGRACNCDPDIALNEKHRMIDVVGHENHD